MPDFIPMRILRVYLGESDRVDGMAAYEHIVIQAHKMGLKGATVYRGVSGFGANSFIHTSKVLRLSEDLPMVVEILDEPERIEHFIEEFLGKLGKGAIAVFDVMGSLSKLGTKASG